MGMLVAALFGLVGLPLIYVALWLSLIVHEAGHAITGHLLGFGIAYVSLGRGSWQRVIVFDHWFVTFRPWPLGGETLCIPRRQPMSRLRSVALSLGGPVSEAALCVVAIVCLRALDLPPGPATLFAYLGFASVAAVSAFGAVRNLVPGSQFEDGRLKQSDGLRLLLRLAGRIPDGRVPLWCSYFLWGGFLCLAGQTRGVLFLRRAARQGYLRNQPPTLLNIGKVLYVLGYPDDAVGVYRAVATQESTGDHSPAIEAREQLAGLVLTGERPDLLSEALQLTTVSVEQCPDAITLRGTLGALLYEAGEIERAEQILTEVVRLSDERGDQAIGSAYLTAIYFQRGEFETARHYRSIAQQRGSDDPVVRRLISIATSQCE